MRDLTTSSILVVGANGGLATETIRHLIADGAGTVVMGGRSGQRVREARDALVRSAPGAATTLEAVGGFDMTDPAAIRAAVDALPGGPFDVVFLAAGGVVFEDSFQHVAWDGHEVERTVFQNVIGAHVTLSRLKERGLLAEGARVVFAGGEGARGIPRLIDKPTFDSPAALREYVLGPANGAAYNPMNAIGVSKFLGALWTTQVAELENGDPSVVWFSPGLTADTNGLANAAPVRRWFIENLGFPLMKVIGKAQSSVAGGRKNADALEGKVGGNGDVVGAPEGGALGDLVDQRPMNDGLRDRALREEFWAILEEVTGPYGG